MMAHFSNGTEGIAYQEHWCFRCQHRSSGNPCPIWAAHFDFCHELCNKEDDPGKQILDMLIPVDDGGWPMKCSMFLVDVGKDAKTVAELKDRAGKLMRDGKMTEAIKVFDLAWDMERTM